MPFGDNRVGNSGQITGLTPPTSNNTNSSSAVIIKREAISKQTINNNVNKVNVLADNISIESDMSLLSEKVKSPTFQGFKNAMSNVKTFFSNIYNRVPCMNNMKDWTPNSESIQSIKTNNLTIKLNLASKRVGLRINNNKIRNITQNSQIRLKNNDGNLVQVNLPQDFKQEMKDSLNGDDFRNTKTYKIMNSTDKNINKLKNQCKKEFSIENFSFIEISKTAFNEALSERPNLSTLMGLVSSFVEVGSNNEINISYDTRKAITDNFKNFQDEPNDVNAQNLIKSMIQACREVTALIDDTAIRLASSDMEINRLVN